jgi:hypothetical protein
LHEVIYLTRALSACILWSLCVYCIAVCIAYLVFSYFQHFSARKYDSLRALSWLVPKFLHFYSYWLHFPQNRIFLLKNFKGNKILTTHFKLRYSTPQRSQYTHRESLGEVKYFIQMGLLHFNWVTKKMKCCEYGP